MLESVVASILNRLLVRTVSNCHTYMRNTNTLRALMYDPTHFYMVMMNRTNPRSKTLIQSSLILESGVEMLSFETWT